MKPRHCLACLLLLLSTALAAADLKLEGTWKLAKPQTTLLPAAGAIPFTDWGKQQYESNKAAAAKGDYEFDLAMSRCSSPGLPRIMLTPDRFKVFIRPGVTSMMFEWNRLLRQIKMDAPAADPDYGTSMGYSWGHWEGKTLVVESRGFVNNKLLDNYLPNGDELRLMERIRLKDANTLEDRITITDPKVFTQPWDVVLTYKRQANEVFPEDVCFDRRAQGQSPLPK